MLTPIMQRRALQILQAAITAAKSHYQTDTITTNSPRDHPQHPTHSGRPLIFADTQDNPGCGGAGTIIDILHACLHAKAIQSYLPNSYSPTLAALFLVLLLENP